MHRGRAWRLKLLIAFVSLGTVATVSVLAVWLRLPAKTPTAFGVTFSTVYARQLGIDWKAAYLAALDELGVRKFRIPVYWSDLEPSPGDFHFEDVDWMLSEAAARGAKVTLVIGRKLPRWPECFIPNWAEQLDVTAAGEAQLDMMRTVVERYRGSVALERWQVENEAFFPFGICPPPDRDLFDREIALVRSLDSHPIMMTESGEIDPWVDAAGVADVLGVSLYRVTWNSWYGFFLYPITPGYYRTRAESVKPFIKSIIISELQAEPWLTKPYGDMSPEERVNAFTASDLRTNVDFAERTGLPEAYLWGVEWWYAERDQNPDLWEEAKKIWHD